MKRIATLSAIATMTVFAFAMTHAGAYALATETTKILPEPTVSAPLKVTVIQPASGHILSVGGLEIKCQKSSGLESWESANSGSGSTLITECKGPLGSICTGEGEPEGLIEYLGKVHFWLALLMTGTTEKETSELVSASVFLPSEVKFGCTNKAKTIEEKIVIKGCVAAPVPPEGLDKLGSSAKLAFTEWKSGQQQVLEVLPSESSTKVGCALKLTVNGGLEESVAVTGVFDAEKFEKGGKEITAEFMS